jgi:CheY-like chemotaxis protein
MIVDDEAPVRAVLTAMLQRLGYTVYAAADGEAGARQVLTYGETLTTVMIDLTMPGVSGDVVARMIRNSFPHMPIILMSGYHADEITREHRDLRSLTFLHKPFTLDTLRAALAQALHRHSTSG